MNKILIVFFYSIICALLLNFENIGSIYKILVLINSLIATIHIFKKPNKPFTMQKIVNIFLLFFFVIANASQYNSSSIVTSLYVHFTDSDYLEFQILVFLILILYNKLYSTTSNSHFIDGMHDSYKLKSKYILLFVSIIATIIIVINFRNNPLKLFFRGFESDMLEYNEDMESNVASSLLFGKIIRPIPIVCYIVGAIFKISKYQKVILFILATITSFPLALARNAVAMYWLPIAIIEIPLFRKKYIFPLIMMFGLLVIFPFFDNFRYFNGELSFKFSFDYFNTMNFDASQEMMYIIKNDVITYGLQLVGVLLFFVPRSIWPTKPVGSGAFIANNQGAFANISMPFWGEGFINFGFIGIIIFSIILAIVTKKIDTSYWINNNNENKNLFVFDGLYLLLLGILLFLLRGDLLSSFAFTVGTIFTYYMIVRICLKKQ